MSANSSGKWNLGRWAIVALLAGAAAAGCSSGKGNANNSSGGGSSSGSATGGGSAEALGYSFTDPAGHFKASFPVKPDTNNQSVPFGNETSKSAYYTAQSSDGNEAFQVIEMPLPSDIAASVGDSQITNFLQTVATGTGAKASDVHTSSITFHGTHAMQGIWTGNASGTAFSGQGVAFAKNGIVYMVSVIGTGSAGANYNALANSFSLTS